jgi:hypothetical protein
MGVNRGKIARETVGVYIPTRRKRPKRAEREELKAADRLAKLLADVDEEEVVAEFEQMRRQKKNHTR